MSSVYDGEFEYLRREKNGLGFARFSERGIESKTEEEGTTIMRMRRI